MPETQEPNKTLDAAHIFEYCELMAKGDYLGDLEQLVLSATLLLGENAYGMTVHEKVEELAEGFREVSLGSAYTTLERLEQKGYIKSWFADPTPERGGRAKKYFKVTATGELALKNSLKVADNMVQGLREIGGVV
jgi:DNA-binding PadR family transcriptional regulator